MIEYDFSKEIISASDVVNEIENFPEVSLICFDIRTESAILEKYGKNVITYLPSSNCVREVYEIKCGFKRFAFTKSGIGGPAVASTIEELAALGTKKIVLFGSSGSLVKNFTSGHIIVPIEAFRDEGASYHYLRPSNYINITSARTTGKLLESIKVPFIYGKTWTTDAFYRETEEKFEKRRKEGCLTVEMECASAAAVAKYREIEFYCFLYTADSLDGDEWKRPDKSVIDEDFHGRIGDIALTVAKGV